MELIDCMLDVQSEELIAKALHLKVAQVVIEIQFQKAFKVQIAN